MALLPFVIGAALLYLAVIAVMFLAQTWLLFPTTLAEATRPYLPAAAEPLKIRASDGTELAGVRLPGARDGAERRPTLLGFGGNATNAETIALYLHELFPERDVVAFHFRGYRPSGGYPSAEALLADAVAIYDDLRSNSPERVIAVGFSIGSGPAAWLARQRPVAGLVLATAFDSLEALARDLYWWAPVGLLLRHRMNVVDFLRGSDVPTALISASRDEVVPARRSAALRGAVSHLVLDRTIEAGHNDIYDNPAFRAALREAVARIEAASGGAAQPR